ncbi:NADPH2:quinone reductase [Capronia epimyces CBS 606.96]|uniref:NADPH2:quinone reductase n=1 Tax=Capronia epimyces CBS 606.96 TaxID=1182542 RepID=W9YAM1_9EURO|nr:NADPH2:quinone reductase [Capronia epimyces CBS 606.96]EXJ89568.1 NADPH2:quinone reductase [Capronia epimyces CBS 606.96]
MATIRAVDIKGGTGPVSALFINSETPKPVPTGSQALVKVKAFGLNRMDLLQREGRYPVPPQAPKTLGVEFSGTIESFGSEPERGFNVGDEVFGLAYGGAYAEYIAVSTHMLVHKPKELSWEEAAGIPETWITATQALYVVGGFVPGKSVLWHAGASSVSIAGIQLAKADNASAIYVTASSREKIEFCKSLGATEGFSYKDGDWAQELLKYTDGKGVDFIIDFVGANYFNQNLDVAARDGHIVNLGLMGGAVVKGDVDIGRFLFKRIRYEGSTLRSRDEEYQGRLRDTLVEHALPRFVDGTFKVVIDKVFKWEDIQEAHELLESSKTMGKLICTID